MRKQPGFTIVELLIVIVIIGILATITIVSYNGLQNRAYDSAVQSDLNHNAKILGIYQLTDPGSGGKYPYGATASEIDPKLLATHMKFTKSAYDTSDANVLYMTDGNGSDFALMAKSKSGKVLYYSSKVGAIREYTGTGSFPTSGSSPFTTALGMNDSYHDWAYGSQKWDSWAE